MENTIDWDVNQGKVDIEGTKLVSKDYDSVLTSREPVSSFEQGIVFRTLTNDCKIYIGIGKKITKK